MLTVGRVWSRIAWPSSIGLNIMMIGKCNRGGPHGGQEAVKKKLRGYNLQTYVPSEPLHFRTHVYSFHQLLTVLLAGDSVPHRGLCVCGISQ